MRLFWISSIFAASLLAQTEEPSIPNMAVWDQPQAPMEESLFLRRIAEFWHEEEYRIAKREINEFLSLFPQSVYADPLRVCLADLHIRAEEYKEALECYSQIHSSDLVKTIFLNKVGCLYHLGEDEALGQLCNEELYRHRLETLNLDSARQSQIETQRSERRSPFPEGKGEEEERFGFVSPSPNSKFQADGGINSIDPREEIKAKQFFAASFYRRCLNAASDPKLQEQHGQKAKECLEELYQEDPSRENGEALAHIYRILHELPKAASLYLEMANRDQDVSEAFDFQAALIQKEYDPTLALESFERLSHNQTAIGAESAYRMLELFFDQGDYESILSHQEALLKTIAEDKKNLGRLWIGKALLASGQTDAALETLTAIEKEDQTEPVLFTLIETAYECSRLDLFDEILPRLPLENPLSAQAKLLYALLLKKEGQIDEARNALKELVASEENSQTIDGPLQPIMDRAQLEEIGLEYDSMSWQTCAKLARKFLQQRPTQYPLGWHLLASSSSHLALQHKDNENYTRELVHDLESLLEYSELFSLKEQAEWKFLLAKGHYDLKQFDQAESLLLALEEAGILSANGNLLLGLCHRDGRGDEAAFCLYAEKALEQCADLIDAGHLSISLFNAYLNLSKKAPELTHQAAKYLLLAFEAGAEISSDNLFWLVAQSKQNPAFWQQSEKILQHLIKGFASEKALYQLGSLYGKMEKWTSEVDIAKQLLALDEIAPVKKQKARLLLAQGYAGLGEEEQALSLLENIIQTGSIIQSKIIAKASLFQAKIEIRQWKNNPSSAKQDQIALMLNNLMAQKNLRHEPIHLEAALEYVNFLSKEPETRILLLEKIKQSFEQGEDLFTQDYLQARETLPKQNRIYRSYLRFIDGEIFLAKASLSLDPSEQKQLQAKAKGIFLQIKEESPHALLAARVLSRLQTEMYY